MKTDDWPAVLARYSGLEEVAASFYVDDVMNAMKGDAESAQLVDDSIKMDESVAPPVVRFPADLNNFTQNAPNACFNPRFIVIHDTEGGFAGALQTLRHGEPGKMRSANYLIRSSDGLIAELVDPSVGYAWHAKNWNPYAIGIEHEARNMKEPGWYTAKMYRASVKLVLYLSEKYKIPLDPDHVFGHNFWQMLEYDHSSMKSVLDSVREPQKQDHVDPGNLWRWDLYFAALHGFDDAFNHLRSKPKTVFHKVR